MSETYIAPVTAKPGQSSMPVLYLTVAGTEFILHEDARRHFREHFKPGLGINMPGYIRNACAHQDPQEVRQMLEKHYECVPWTGHVAVLGPKLNGNMAQLRKNRTLRDIVADDAGGQHTIQRGSGREIDDEDREMLASNIYGTLSFSPSRETQ